jgi:hypothetical protein
MLPHLLFHQCQDRERLVETVLGAVTVNIRRGSKTEEMQTAPPYL